MKVIIDKNNPLVIETQEGEVLFNWQPETPTTKNEFQSKPMSEEDKIYICNQLRSATEDNTSSKFIMDSIQNYYEKV